MAKTQPKLIRLDEAVPPNGAVFGDGVRKLMGNPRLTQLQLLVRESMQNSWDARLPQERPNIAWSVRELVGASDLEPFTILRGAPKCDGVNLAQALKRAPILLSVTDEFTVGLAGPTRADRHSPGEKKNFVSFVRNVGQHTSLATSTGGTYGFGKSSFFRSSLCGTILVFSRVLTADGEFESRFIACLLGDPLSQQPPLTGRSWWGAVKNDVVEPLLGRNAVGAAEYFGMPMPSDDTTGTTVSVVAPRFSLEQTKVASRSRDIARDIESAVLWNFWPKLSTSVTEDGLSCSIDVNGEPFPMSDPAKHPRVKWFVEAYNAAKRGKAKEPTYVTDIASQRPAQHLGRLAIVGPAPLITSGVPDGPLEDPVRASLHHVALMRQPELVVTYREMDAPLDDQLHFAGVFIADESVDAAFAAAEPPSHDDWNHNAIEDSVEHYWKTYVKVAERRIKEVTASRLAELAAPRTSDGDGGAFGALSQHLGKLLAGAHGDTPSPKVPGVGKSNKGKTPIRVAKEARLQIDGQRLLAVLGVEILNGGSRLELLASGNVQIAGGSLEKEAPAGAPVVQVLGWRDASPGASAETSSETLNFEPGQSLLWEALFEVPVDAAFSLSIDLRGIA